MKTAFLSFSFHFLLILFSISVSLSSCESIKMFLNKEVNGSIPFDDGYHYYNLTLPESTESNKSILTFTVKADQSNLGEGDELFSDPDIYISLIHHEPNHTNSEWYSERYGSDILSISKNYTEPNKTFYIALYCQFKCNYTMKAYLTKEVELLAEKVYSVVLKKQSSINYFIKIPNQAYEEFDIIATSPHLREFKIFAHKDNPSSQHTFPITPSWIGGYLISVDNTQENYCEGCEYHILIQSGDHDNIIVELMLHFQGGITKVKKNINVYDVAKKSQTRCYKYELNKNIKNKNKPIILQNTIFSGNGILHILGWNPPINEQKFDTIQNNNYSFAVSSIATILLNETDYQYFDEQYNNDDNKDIIPLYYCFYSKLKSTFSTSVKILSESTHLQSQNFIIPGKEQSGFLPKNSTTSYKILEFKESSTITITHEKLEGDSQIFGYFCSKSHGCSFNNKHFQEELNNHNLLIPIEKHNGYELEISNKDNKCFENKTHQICSTILIVRCFNEEGICSYVLRARSKESIMLMVPHMSYYNLLSKGQNDKYQITISDESIHSAVIVLNSVSGDAELLVYKIKEEQNEKKLIGLSLNNDYIPDVVRITPKCVNCDGVIGNYLVYVTTKTFSAYNLYYYTTFKHDDTIKKPTFSDITIELKEGNILQDHFPTDIQYKVYSFSPINYPAKPKEDIRIVLTRINLPYTFRVYLDLDKFEYSNDVKSQHQDRFKGYDWTANYNNELTISKDDPKYSLTGPYYIIVGKSTHFSSESIDNSTVGSYYIGATTEKTPFLLYEGKPHSSTLNTNYPKQVYGYTHFNINKPFEINVNVYHGEVNVYVYLDSYRNSTNQNLIAFKERINYHDVILIGEEEMKTKCQNRTYCQAFILVSKTKSDSDGQYVIVAKTKDNKGEIMTPGIVKVGKLSKGESKNYYIEEYEKRKGSSLSIAFYSGYGDIYIRIPPRPENASNMVFPNETNYDYKGEDTYLGKIINLPSKVFQVLDKDHPKIQLLITVIAINDTYLSENETIEYIISYSSEPKRINQNIPYNNYIKTGEFQYFTFYFDNFTENIYISLSNMNGDADIYLNYGDETYPSPSQSDWISLNTFHEFIQINKNDSFFIENNLTSIGGYYTLLIYGYEETTYSLFVSSTNKPILTLYDNSPTSCRCYSNKDKCFFRYGNFYEYTSSNSDDDLIQIIFTSQYIYGTGIMYEKLYKDSEVMNSVTNIEEMFPNETNHDFCTKESKQRNYMKISINKKNNTKYTKDSMLLLTVQCLEPSLVDINIATMIENEYDYLDENRENIYFLKKSETSTLLSFYNSLKRDLIIEAFAYVGSGFLEIFSNSTTYDKKNNKTINHYEKIADYYLGVNKSTQQMMYTVLKNKPSLYDKNIYFKVKPLDDFGFYIKLIYNQKWNAIPLNKQVPLIIENNQMMGYIDIVEQYEDIEINIIIEDNLSKKAELYVKVNAIQKNYTNETNTTFSSLTEEELYGYSVPSTTNYDFKGESDPVLGSVLVTMKDLPKPTDPKVSIRALFYLIIYNIDDSEYEDDDENEYNIPEKKNIPNESKITILVTPCVNNYKRIDAVALNYYFSNQLSHHNKETKIFSLERMEPDDTIMIIEISSCSGEYEVSITDELTLYNNETNIKTLIPFVERKSNGRHIITVSNLKSKHYYLIIKAKDNSECSLYNYDCSGKDELHYFMYYYTTKQNYLKKSILSSIISYESIGKGSIKINLPTLREIDIQGNERNVENISFDVFITQNEDEFSKMESVCFLTTMIAEKRNSSRLYKNIKVNENSIVIKGLRANEKYYVNVLAENRNNKELITFRPLLIIPNGYGISFWMGAVIVLSIAGLISVAVYFYKKYKITKTVLKYETSDIRNLSTIPKSEAEMVHIAVQSEREKYKNLSPDIEKIDM